QRCREIVLAGSEAEDSELTDVVRRSASARGDQPAASLSVLVANRADLSICRRLTEFIHNTPGHDAALRQGEVHFLPGLAVAKLERLARLKRPRLPVRDRDMASLGRGQTIPAGRQLFQLVASFRIGVGEAILAQFRGERANLDPAQRLAGVGCKYVSGDS